MTAVDDFREFDRHRRGEQHVYDVSGHQNHPEPLCAEHARQVLDQHHHKTMLGLSTGLSDPQSESPDPQVSKPHLGQCRGCARQLAVGDKQLKPSGFDDHAPGRASPYTTKAPGSFSRAPERTVEPFHALPPSLNAQQPPTDLNFEHTEQPSGGSKWPTEHMLTAHTQGGKAGHLRYFTGPRERRVLVDTLQVEHDRQRQGIGSALMDEMQRRHPDASINHGDRTDAGKAWWSDYSKDKTVRRGRTADKHGVPGGEVFNCACGLPVEYDPIDGWQHTDGSISHDGELYGKSVSDLMGDIRPRSARFTPEKRIFTHTCGLDHRLFDENGKLRPDVRGYIVSMLTAFWMLRYRNGRKWAKVYFAGSEASEWTSDSLEGNNDFDVLIGVDYDAFRTEHGQISSRAKLTDQQITDRMNEEFRSGMNPLTKAIMIDVDGTPTGPWDNTWYVNPDSYDIRKIKPYAAYDVTGDTWVVKPPHLPHWSLSDFPKPVVRTLRAADDYTRAVLKLPEPERTQQGAALFEAWHEDRSRAFSERGEGWYDVANLREKWLDQHGLWAELVDCAHRAKEGLDLAPADWSNTPPGYVASLPKTQTCKYCSQQATQRVIHSEGMAYIPVCDKHLAKGKSDAADCTPDGSYDPSNINAIRPIAAYADYVRDAWNRKAEQPEWDEKTKAQFRQNGEEDYPYPSQPAQHHQGEDWPGVGWVQTDKLAQYPDREPDKPEHWLGGKGGSSERIVNSLREGFRDGEGWEHPIQLHYHPGSNTTWMGEGNHRLRAAELEGHTHVPVTVRLDRHRPSQGKPFEGERKHDFELPEEDNGRIHPKHLLPSDWLSSDKSKTASTAPPAQWITPQLFIGPMPRGLNHARQVGSPEEALAAIKEGFTAVLPHGTEMGLWRILSELGMSRLEITQHLNLLASTPGA